jgi:hypothetical protein
LGRLLFVRIERALAFFTLAVGKAAQD